MIILLILTFTIVVATISYGLVQKSKEDIEGKQRLKKALRINLASFIPVIAVALLFMVPSIVHAAADSGISSGVGLGYLAVALSTGLACVGAGYAVGAVGSSALGAISEDPKILGKTLIYVGLGEGIAIYGLIISIVILNNLQ